MNRVVEALLEILNKKWHKNLLFYNIFIRNPYVYRFLINIRVYMIAATNFLQLIYLIFFFKIFRWLCKIYVFIYFFVYIYLF